uniref:Fibronectin type-III domain-containing protein n=1 Tax=Biomphalaria glabrata TaxID=6526 RepID=A0A2C9M8Y9_BIOGL
MMHDVVIRRVNSPELITSDLDPNTQYIYEIIAYNILGNQSAATIGNFETKDADNDAVKDNNQDSSTAMIVMLSIGWFAAVAAFIKIVCIRIRRKPKLDLRHTDSQHSTARPSIERSRSAIFENETLNDYNSLPQNTQHETTENNEENSSQQTNESRHQPNNSRYANACFEPTSITSNNIYDAIRDINPALRFN